MQTENGRVALVTGASRGIGAAIAKRLAQGGYRIVGTYRQDAVAARAVEEEIRAGGGACDLVVADQRDPEALRGPVDLARARYGRLDAFVANAASTAFLPLMDLKLHQMEKTFAVTVQSFLLGTQLCAPLLAAAPGKPGGVVLAISGIDSQQVLPMHGLLGSCKAAMEVLVRYLAVELSGLGIRANTINPGILDTASSRMSVDQERWKHVVEWTAEVAPAGRMGTPEDVADLSAFLCSERSSYLNGQTITLDGGIQCAAFVASIAQRPV